MSVLATSSMERNAARMASLRGREGDGGGKSLDVMRMFVLLLAMCLSMSTMTLAVNAQSGVLGSTDVADEEFSVAFRIGQLEVLREVEGDEDAALLDLLGVNNASITTS